MSMNAIEFGVSENLRLVLFYPATIVFGLLWAFLFWRARKRATSWTEARNTRWSALLAASVALRAALSVAALTLARVIGYSEATSALATIGVALPAIILVAYGVTTAAHAWRLSTVERKRKVV